MTTMTTTITNHRPPSSGSVPPPGYLDAVREHLRAAALNFDQDDAEQVNLACAALPHLTRHEAVTMLARLGELTQLAHTVAYDVDAARELVGWGGTGRAADITAASETAEQMISARLDGTLAGHPVGPLLTEQAAYAAYWSAFPDLLEGHDDALDSAGCARIIRAHIAGLTDAAEAWQAQVDQVDAARRAGAEITALMDATAEEQVPAFVPTGNVVPLFPPASDPAAG